MKNLTALRAFKITYLGATNHKPARIKVTDLRYGQTIIVNYTAAGSNSGHDRAIEFLTEQGIEISAHSWHEADGRHQYSLLLTDNFMTQIK